MILKIENLSPMPLPEYATDGSAGIDLSVWEEKPREGEDSSDAYGVVDFIGLTKMFPRLVGTGVKVEIPKGYFGMLVARSSLQKQFISLANGIGIIDSDYRGEIKIPLVYWGNERYTTIKNGARVAQLIILPYEQLSVIYGKLSGTNRGEDGFGSTGY